jgi:hypothetical protein
MVVLPDVPTTRFQIERKTMGISALMMFVLQSSAAVPNVVISSAAATVVQQTVD